MQWFPSSQQRGSKSLFSKLQLHGIQETEKYFYGISKTCKYCNKETLKHSYNGIFLPLAEDRGKCVSSSDPDSEFFPFNQPGCSLLIFLICEPSKRKRIRREEVKRRRKRSS